ncbi:MAG: transcription elongation factor GreA [Oligoflexales bacterium]|nr:transcription elongation factor GreA [Oligoflexales bacterium]
MSLTTIPLTKEGHHTLVKELEQLKTVERPAVILAIAAARAHGDLRENAEYHAAREKQGFIEARIADLDDKLSRAEVINLDGKDVESVRFGAWVTLEDAETGETRKYRIVGDLEADVAHHSISISSPIARALLGKKEDELVEIVAPGGKKEFTILKVEA